MGKTPRVPPSAMTHFIKSGAISEPLEKVVQEMVEARLKKLSVKDPERTRSMSIKLDGDRYRRFNRARYELDLTGQDIFIEALDMWFRAKKF